MSDTQQNEVQSIGNLLSRTADIAEQAGITGVYDGGAKRCVQQYNASVARLETLGALPTGFFQPLADDAGFGESGIACAQLASYIGAAPTESGAVYHGPKYNIMNNHGGGPSTEEMQELRELAETLRQRAAEG